MSQVLGQINDMGIIQKFKRDHAEALARKDWHVDDVINDQDPIKMEQLLVALCFLNIGYIVALLAFLLEKRGHFHSQPWVA